MERKHLILSVVKTKQRIIQYCEYNPKTQRYNVTFSNRKTYSYGFSSIAWYKEPQALDVSRYQITVRGKLFENIQSIFVFRGIEEYWHIVFQNGQGRTYQRNELDVVTSCSNEKNAINCLAYLRALSAINELKNSNGDLLLKKQYDTLTFVSSESALAIYLNPEEHPICTYTRDIIIFPFGGNESQFKAVRNALTNQMSIIQGPPGTGKTQTILNIIANLLLQKKTIQIVSNNNSAVSNVLEKLVSPKYDLGFLVASLGKKDNKDSFISSQIGRYPDLSLWKRSPETVWKLRERIGSLVQELTNYFDKQERLACVKQELAALEVETRYFENLYDGLETIDPSRTFRQNLKSVKVLEILQKCENCLEQEIPISFGLKVKSTFFYGMFEWNYYNNGISAVIAYLQKLFYLTKHRELTQEIETLLNFLQTTDAAGKMAELTQCSIEYLHAILFQRYGERKKRECFSQEDLWKNPANILREYPVILSTTFSSRSSMKNVMYDYIIMDEASQVDLTTGALALSCAKNAVIVGDLKQLPNVISDIMKKQSNAIFNSYQLPSGYSYSDNSFLKSVSSVIPSIPQTLLREHYRCHPKIIGFCNQKFYHNELIIMTEDHGEKDVLSVYRTPVGNHSRGHLNQRQVDVTVKEVLPNFSATPPENIGIITPYRKQAMAVSAALDGNKMEIDTVHKFQGREKDVIILNVVDNEVTAFSDDPYLLNVAISRAKKRLCLVTSGNEQPRNSNIQDLISYIEYNNFSIIDSEIHSVFDLLYQQYTKQRIAFLSKHRKVSDYDSENLMYAALMEILAKHQDAPFNIICHQRVCPLIRKFDKLTDEERRYASHPSTHVDFLIYNRISKAPVLAIEVDGFHYHKNGTLQAERDKLKDSIFRKYQIPLLRFPTYGSGEIGKIEHFLFE